MFSIAYHLDNYAHAQRYYKHMVSKGVRWSGVAAVAFGVATAPIAVNLSPSPGPYTLSIPLSAIVTGGIVWFLVVERRESNPLTSGTIAGVLTGLLSHFTYWVIVNLWEPEFFVQSIPGMPFMAIFSMATFGVLTAPLGLIAGLILGYLRKRST